MAEVNDVFDKITDEQSFFDPSKAKKKEETKKWEPTPIDSDDCELCPNCNYGYNCTKCGLCECAKPDSKIKKAQEKFQKAWDSRKGGNY